MLEPTKIDGAIIIDKPVGITSHDVVSRMRRILRTKKIGHTGTLDPFATGVLVMLVGKATRLARFLDKDEKSYEAVVRFGFETDTGDREGAEKQNSGVRSQDSGREIQESDISTVGDSRWQSQPPAVAGVTEDENSVAGIQESADLPSKDELLERVNAVLPLFTGEIEQIPPMYSAKKVKGKKLYELAREGIEIDREPVAVHIREITVLGPDNPVIGPNEIVFRVTCSAGTYIRTLAEDIGKQIGIGCHLAELRRVRAGRFGLEDAITLEELEQITEAGSLSKNTLEMSEIVGHLPTQTIDDDGVKRISTGLKIASSIDVAAEVEVRLIDDGGQLVAIGETDHEGNIQPKAVFSVT